MAVGSSNDFDLVVLGAGTGGYTAAFRAAQLGLRVALVDEDKIGGTCLHRGCIPTKALLESAEMVNRARHLKDYGVVLPGEPAIDYATMAERRDQVVKRMWTGRQEPGRPRTRSPGSQGRGRLDGPGRVRVLQAGEDGTPGAGGERVLQATDIIIATGSRVKSLPGLEPDGERILTSDDVLRRDTAAEEPDRSSGAGAVGVEFASFYHDIGTQVTLLEYLPAIVPLEDHEVSQLLERSFTRRGIRVMTKARFDPAAVKADRKGVRAVGRPGGRGARGDRGRGDARGHRPRRQRRGDRARDDEGRARPGRHQGERPDADPRAARLRDRRRRRRAVAGPHRRSRGDRRRPHDRRRRRRPRDRLRRSSPGRPTAARRSPRSG